MTQFRVIEVEVVATVGWDGPRAGPGMLWRQRLEPMTHLGGTSELWGIHLTGVPSSEACLGRSDLGELNPRPAPMTFSYRSCSAYSALRAAVSPHRHP